MSVERVWRWRCDACGRVIELVGYGMPRGWYFAPVRIEATGQSVTAHRCAGCGPGQNGKRPSDSYASEEPREVVPPSSETGGRVPPCRSTDAGS